MNLDLDALRSFVAIADLNSFTGAAGAVSRTQSTVSAQIKKLEDRLGFSLFERTKRTLAITPRGAALLEYARAILRLHDDGVRAVTSQPVRGRLRLGITEYFVPEHLPSLFVDFRRLYPDLELEFSTGMTGDLRRRQQAGELDLVIGRRDPGNKEGEFIRAERLYWVAAPSFKLSPKSTVPLALLPVGCGVRALATSTLDKLHRPWTAIYQGASVLGIQAAVSSGLGVGCLTKSAVQPDYRVLGAREGLPSLPSSEIALYTRGRKPSKELAALIELVRNHFANPLLARA